MGSSSGNKHRRLFSYRGLNEKKVRVSGQIYARGEEDLARSLAEKNVYLLSCRRCRRPPLLKPNETAWLLDQLQLLLQAGLPIPEALRVLQTNAAQRIRIILSGVLDTVESGYGLAAGLKPYLKPRARVAAHLVQIGEQNGQLPGVLEKLAAEHRHAAQIKQNIIQSLAYPAVLIVMAVCIVSGMMVWLIPEFKKIYAGLGADLPVYTLITIRLSEWMSRFGLQLLMGLFGLTALLSAVVRRHSGTRWLLAHIGLRLPFFGRLRRAYLCRCFASHLRIIYRSGATLNEAFSWLPATSNHAVYGSALRRIRMDLSQGNSLRHAVRSSGFFPDLVEQIIASGESSGSLEQALARIEALYGAALQSMAAQLPRLLEPVLIIFISAAIGWILVSLYLPIFNLGFVL